MTQHLVIVVRDPIFKDYSDLLKYVLIERTFGLSGIDILIDVKVTNYHQLNSALSQLYNRVRKIATEVGYDYNFSINVLFNKGKLLRDWRFIFVYKDESSGFEIPAESTVVELTGGPLENTKFNHDSTILQIFNISAVGGTFDHLHDGHKILLSSAVFLTKSKLVVGITGPVLLKNKKFSETLESFGARQASVTNFLNLLTRHSSLERNFRYEIYQINDVCGPTGYLRDLDALIVSEESVKGGEFVNNYRAERGFEKLVVAVIDVIGGDAYSNNENNWKGKLSSTDIRELELKKKSWKT